MVTTQMISQCNLFADLSKEQLGNFASLCEEVTCPEGEMVFCEGAWGKRLFLFLEGMVVLQTLLAPGPESITLAVINQPYQVFGWSAVVPPHYYTATAFCHANSRLLALNGKEFLHELEKDPVAGLKIMQRIAEVISVRLRKSRLALLAPLLEAVRSLDESL